MIAVLSYILILFAAFGGVILSIYIRHKKQTSEKMVCPLGSDCNTVIESEFSHFLGAPVELLGMGYYVIIALLYASIAVAGSAAPIHLVGLAFFLSLLAFLFSLYLTFIQVFTLRKLCTWCLTSAGLTTLIFIIGLFAGERSFVELLAHYHGALVGVHLLGVALGIGAATAADLLFLKFLKDFKISQHEANTLRTMSQIIWLGIAVIVVSGLGIFLVHPDENLASALFITKMIVVGVIIVNGAILNLYIQPKLVHLDFSPNKKGDISGWRRDRRLAFATGAISFTSWYSAFVLGATRSTSLGVGELLLVYLGLLALAVLGSQVLEHVLGKRAHAAAERHLH